MSVREIRVSRWRRDWFWALLLLALVFIAYTQVFWAGFIWDDESHLTQNPCVVGPLGLKETWTTTQAEWDDDARILRQMRFIIPDEARPKNLRVRNENESD